MVIICSVSTNNNLIQLKNEIDKGHYDLKPGWVRLSLHPTMTEKDVLFISKAINDVVSNADDYKKDYVYLPECNDYQHRNECNLEYDRWFDLGQGDGRQVPRPSETRFLGQRVRFCPGDTIKSER